MKLRQKFAAVLATAMVITSVPVVTMAASGNTLTKEVIKLAKDETTTTNAVKVEFKDAVGTDANKAKEVFYLELENAEWDFEAATDATLVPGTTNKYTFANLANVTYEKQSDTIVKVTANVTTGQKVYFPIVAKATGGDAKVSVVSKNGNTTVTSSTFVFATTSDAQAIVTAKTTDLPTVFNGGAIADIMITESMENAFSTLEGDDLKIEITLDNDDFKFTGTGDVEFAYGFDSSNSKSKVGVRINPDDKQTLIVTLPGKGNALKSDGIGQIKLTGVEVTPTVKTPETGDLKVTVDGDAMETSTTLTVAKVSNSGSTIEVASKDEVTIKAGETKTVKFTMEETEVDAFINGREFDITLDKGYIMDQEEDSKGKYDEEATLAELTKTANKLVKIKNTKVTDAIEITDAIVKDEKVVGFTAKMVTGKEVDGTTVKEVKDKFEIEIAVTAGLLEEGDVTVTASGRALANEVSAVVTKITKVLSIDTEAAVLKVGLQGQKAGKIVLTEAEKAMFKSGKDIVVLIPAEKGITLDRDQKVSVEVTAGDIQMDTATISKVLFEDADGKEYIQVIVPVKRTSKTASTIEISNIEFTTDRTVEEGAFDVKVAGSALSEKVVNGKSEFKEMITVEDFLVIGTPNTEDITASNGLAKGTAAFVIGEATYTVNGTAKEMDAKSYIQDPGFTMVPVRYVAEAFGVAQSDILFSAGTATIFAGNRTVQLTAGSNVAIVNGASVTMGTKVVVKEGRTYAPVGEVARILGISTNWDSATKTATFTNK